jgi:hypothetical protein
MPTRLTSRTLAALSCLMLVSCVESVDKGRGDAAVIVDSQGGRGGSGGSGGSAGSGGSGGMSGTGGASGSGGTGGARVDARRDTAARMDTAVRRDGGVDARRDAAARLDGGNRDTGGGARIVPGTVPGLVKYPFVPSAAEPAHPALQR